MNNKIKVKYFSEYIDEHGVKHYTVNTYNTASQTVTMFKDLIFDK